MTDALLRLRTGQFQPRAADVQAAARLASGVLQLRTTERNLADPGLFDQVADPEDPDLLSLHTLRWLDVLLRVPDGDEGCARLWDKLVARWWAAESVRNMCSDATRLWTPAMVLQRCSVLACGVCHDRALDPALVEAHVSALEKALPRVSDAEALRRAGDAYLVLRRGDHAAAWDVLSEELRTRIRPGGLPVAPDLAAMFEERENWRDWLSAVNRDRRSEPLLEYLAGWDFWIHAHQPSGTLVALGSASPPDHLLDAVPELEYVRTGGRRGSPIAETYFAEPELFAAGRSGWGETERLLTEENHWSMVCGRARGREAHQDAGRVTFSTGGTDWLVDPNDECCQDARCHSTLWLAGHKYRYGGVSELPVARETSEFQETLLAGAVWQSAIWNRRVLYLRSSGYLVVEDALRGLRSAAEQVWMFAPEAVVALTGSDEVLVHLGARALRLSVVRTCTEPLILDRVESATGDVVAVRLRVPLEPGAGRAITILGDVTGRPTLSSLATSRLLVDDERVIDLEGAVRADRLVLTRFGPRLMGRAGSPEEALEETAWHLVQGGRTHAEARALRLQARELIRDMKDLVRRDSGARLDAFSRVAELIQDEGLPGLRDHGLGAALVDLASPVDETQVQLVRSLVRASRSPLVAWTGDDVQEFYELPLRTTLSPSNLPALGGGPTVWSVDLGQLVPSALISPTAGETMLVYFHGATDRARLAMPRYERWRSFGSIGQGPAMFFSDPTLDLDPHMVLGWFMGTEAVDLHRVCAEMIDAAMRSLGAERVVLVGNSAGGFAALQVASHLAGAEVVAVNSQIDLSRYTPRFVDGMVETCFGCSLNELPPRLRHRVSVIERCRQVGLKNRVLVYQNTGDEHHLVHHHTPFLQAAEELGMREALTVRETYLGTGHVPPGAEVYRDLVSEWIDDMRVRGSRYQGLRSR